MGKRLLIVKKNRRWEKEMCRCSQEKKSEKKGGGVE
jgi:hypothetical protein